VIKIDMAGIKKLSKELEKTAKKAVPHAARNALNSIAFEGRKEWVASVNSSMTLRNTFTTRSLQVIKASGISMPRMQATLGSTAPYMGDREEGKMERARGKHGVPLPTPASAGQGGRQRTKLVRRANTLPAITLGPRTGRSAKQRNAIAIRQAAQGTGYAFLELNRHMGIYKVTGTKRLRVRLIWDLSVRSLKPKPLPTLAQAIEAVSPKIPALCERAIIDQLKRNKVLGY
jgi:hypothetical protein